MGEDCGGKGKQVLKVNTSIKEIASEEYFGCNFLLIDF
jgi:hypothetical protein